MDSKPTLCIVGAGPGDPELLTLKAAKRLGMAAVVLYDNLANRELLAMTPAGCEHIYVGKLAYGPYTPQERIHELILQHIHKGLVIRLKGGDPFIFGRGFEEVLFAREHGIDTEYIPGITSMQSFGMHGIPLTSRGLSESLWVITGTKQDEELSSDLILAMKSKATVVIYMGLKKLESIAQLYVAQGAGDFAAALIQNASMANARFLCSTIAALPQLAREQGFTYPSILLIGKVASDSLLQSLGAHLHGPAGQV